MSEIVIDLGCQPQRIDRSIEPLIDRFDPEMLYGFDPAASPPYRYKTGQTMVRLDRSAAWVHNGTLQFSARTGIEGTVMSESSAWNGRERPVPCFDFPAWLGGFATDEVILKLDIEGAELPVLEKMIKDGTDDRISLLLVEWHDDYFDRSFTRRRKKVEKTLRCPVEIWP